ncbi:MAG TPA: DUF5818 domain-containing protein [Pyrinomonadaceae bacterium]|jgi:hypothetical protein
MFEKVLSVDDIHVSVLLSLPAKLVITAFGTVGTPGWSNAHLVEHIYVAPPADGIYEFDFEAEPPTGNVIQVVMPIKSHPFMTTETPDMKGIRVIAKTNSMEFLLRGENKPSGEAFCVEGTLTDEGVECQAMRSDGGELYTLTGDLRGFGNGDEVIVCGTIAEVSICQQGKTINVSWISKKPVKPAEKKY